MDSHQFASYKSGAFSIDISNFEFEDGFVAKTDLPAFVHEYCHYIQDVTTISGIFGFSLWMRDVVALTQVFSDGEKKNITIPLPRDSYNETINKYRKFYNLYCGNPNDVFDFDFNQLRHEKTISDLKDITLDGQTRKLMINKVLFSHPNKEVHFGLIALQEIHAFYAQCLTEQRLGDLEFNTKSESLPSFPYKMGDFLFNKFDISIDLISKYVLVELCLDTVQAPSVFLQVLEILRGKSISFSIETILLLRTSVNACSSSISWSKDDALQQILPDLIQWSKDSSRKYLSQALKWYIDKIELGFNIKKISDTIFTSGFYGDWNALVALFKIFPPPVYIDHGIMKKNYNRFPENADLDDEFEKSFEAASTIWSHRILYELLVSESVESINEKCKCPLFEGCTIKEVINDEYTCVSTPWEIIKNKDGITCQFGMASHSFGLWQNSIQIGK